MRLLKQLKQCLMARFAPDAEIYRKAFNNAADALVVAQPDGLITAVSAATCRMWGYTQEELIGANVTALMPHAMREGHDAHMQKYQGHDGQEQAMGAARELRGRRKDGSEFPIEVTISSTRAAGRRMFIAVLRDISERKAAEEAVRTERDRAARYLESVDAVIISLNREGVITLVNRKACELLGWGEPELLGRNWFETCVPAQEACELGRDYDISMTRRQPLLEYYEGRVLCKDGRVRIFAFYNRMLSNAAGEPEGVIISGQDISEHRQMEQRHRQVQNKMQQAQKMQAIGQLTGGIAHDFNNILTSIIGYAQLAQMMPAISNDAELSRYLSEIFTAGERAKNLVAQMLAFSRSGKGDAPAVLDIREELEGLLPMLRAAMPSAVELRTHLAPKLPATLLGKSDLQQVIMNLCLNARDAMSHSGNIHVSLSLDAVEAHCASCHESFHGEFLKLRIEDEGSGMDARRLGRIFDPFFTSKEPGKGTGLGLSVVHGIVHQAGGHIAVNSEEGRGTVMEVFFKPHARERREAHHPEALDHVLAGTAHGHSVLLVEASESQGRRLAGMLSEAGYDVHQFEQAGRALEAFRAAPSRFALLITAQSLPDMSGTQLAGAALAMRPELRVILTSTEDDDVDTALLQECDIAHLSASLDDNAILERIAQV